jgi:hypothetical protein
MDDMESVMSRNPKTGRIQNAYGMGEVRAQNYLLPVTAIEEDDDPRTSSILICHDTRGR